MQRLGEPFRWFAPFQWLSTLKISNIMDDLGRGVEQIPLCNDVLFSPSIENFVNFLFATHLLYDT